MAHKFGSLSDQGNRPHIYPDIWQREKTTGPSRLVLAPSTGQVELLGDLSSVMPEPFGILYLLLASRCGHQTGRYQIKVPMERDRLRGFLTDFRDYLEGDGRHHLWIASLDGISQVIYDNHNVIYAYGDLEAFAEIARRRKMIEQQVRFPVPHTHCYNAIFDSEEDRIFNEYEWIRSPLQPNDEP